MPNLLFSLYLGLVPEAGFEPASPFGREILSHLRIPFRHSSSTGILAAGRGARVVWSAHSFKGARTMKRTAVLFGVALISLATIGLPAAAHAAKGKKATVKVVNKSDWELHHFFLSSTGEDEWGPDQLGDEVIGTDESFQLNQIPCDSYDVRLIDEDD